MRGTAQAGREPAGQTVKEIDQDQMGKAFDVGKTFSIRFFQDNGSLDALGAGGLYGHVLGFFIRRMNDADGFEFMKVHWEILFNYACLHKFRRLG